jgi:hypothetical protein
MIYDGVKTMLKCDLNFNIALHSFAEFNNLLSGEIVGTASPIFLPQKTVTDNRTEKHVNDYVQPTHEAM